MSALASAAKHTREVLALIDRAKPHHRERLAQHIAACTAPRPLTLITAADRIGLAGRLAELPIDPLDDLTGSRRSALSRPARIDAARAVLAEVLAERAQHPGVSREARRDRRQAFGVAARLLRRWTLGAAS